MPSLTPTRAAIRRTRARTERSQDATFDMPQDSLEVSPNNLRIETYADRKAATVSVLRQARKRINSKDASPRSSRVASRDTSRESVTYSTSQEDVGVGAHTATGSANSTGAQAAKAKQSLIDQINDAGMDQEANGGSGGPGRGGQGAASAGSEGVGAAAGGQPGAQASSGRGDRRASFNSKLWDLSKMSEANPT